MSRLFSCAVLAFLSFVGAAAAQLPPGKGGYAFPPGGKAGTTVEVRLGGTDWTPDLQFFVQDARVKLQPLGKPGVVLMPEPPYWFDIKSFANDPKLSREVAARFVLPAGLPPGPVRWSVANANGTGGGGVFVVGDGEEVIEDERRRGPQELKALPITINGRLRRIEEVDRYRFTATHTGMVTCELAARQLGSDFNGVLEAHEGDTKLGEAFDTEGIDPALSFPVVKGRAYVVSLRDIDHRGYRCNTYRLRLTPGPRVLAAFPPAGKRGEKRVVEFVGVGIATGQAKIEKVTKEVVFPRDAAETVAYHLVTPHGTAPAFKLLLSDVDEALAPLARLAIPGAVSGRIARRGERVSYAFAGKKGESVSLRIHAVRLGSPVDATLAVLGSDGKPIAARDDSGGRPDPRVTVTLPMDGEYRVVVADVSGKVPGPEAVYRLSAHRPAPGFSLRVAGTGHVPIGGKANLTVSAVREGGFLGPITLAVTGLPAGVTVPASLLIPAKAISLPVPLECAKTAGATASFVKIVGTATVDGKPVVATAFLADGELLLPELLVAATMKPPFKVKAEEADGGRRVPRGATHLSPIRITRDAGFTGEVVLDMAATQSRHRQGIRGPALPVPGTQAKVDYPVFLPEWLETVRTSRIALVAQAVVPDPKGVPRHLLAAMEGQITLSIEGAMMKLSHAAEELAVAPGQSFAVPLRLARLPKMTGPVSVELVVPQELAGLVTAASLVWPGDKEAATLAIATKDDARLVGAWTLTARATAKKDGHPVVSESEFEVEFVRPAKK